MSLEVDGRHGNVPMSHQREIEGFKQVNGDISYNIPPTAEVHDAVGTASEYVGPLKISKPRYLGLGRRVRVRQGLIFCWGVLFALVFVLAVVAAVVAGSIAVRREKQIETWFFLCFKPMQGVSFTDCRAIVSKTQSRSSMRTPRLPRTHLSKSNRPTLQTPRATTRTPQHSSPQVTAAV